MFMKRIFSVLCAFCFTSALYAADPIVLNANHPDRYIVKQGDTLWEIAARFLRDPWRWPDVWDFNAKIDNPQYLYPGDVITLVTDSGKPMLKVQRGEANKLPTTKLSPKIHATKLDREIPLLQMEAIRQFVSQPRVLTERELENSAYLVSSQGDRLVNSVGDNIYARGLPPNKNTTYAIYRTGRAYRNMDAKTDDILGYEALYVGTAQLKVSGDPATLQISDAAREALVGDRLLPVNKESDATWTPHAPDMPLEGRIIQVVDGVARIGQYQTVVLNLGEYDGVQKGHVLAIYRAGREIRDVVTDDPRDALQTPDSRAGLALVYRTFDRVSYALIMRADTDIQLYDVVKKP